MNWKPCKAFEQRVEPEAHIRHPALLKIRDLSSRSRVLKNSRPWFLLAQFFLVLTTTVVNAQTVQFVSGEWAPLTGEKLPGQGFVTEVVQAAAKAGGLSAEISFVPWLRSEQMVKEGLAFAAFPYVKSAERQKVFDFSDAISISHAKVFYFEGFGKPISWTSLKDFHPYTMGAVRGSVDVEWFVKARIKTEIAMDSNSAFKMLQAGRIDYFPENESVGWESINKLFPKAAGKFHTLDKPYSNNSLHLLVSRSYPKSAELLSKFNAGLVAIRKDGTFEAILAKQSALMTSCSAPIEVAFSSINREMDFDKTTGKYSGAAYEFLMRVEKSTGCVFNFLLVPRARAWKMLKDGEIAVVPTAIRTAERDGQAKFIDQMVRSSVAFMSLKGLELGVRSTADLISSTLRIGVVRGFDYGPEYMKMLANPELQSHLQIVVDTDTLARMLALGRIDGVVIRPSAFTEAAHRAGIVDQVEVHLLEDVPPVPAGLYLLRKRLSEKDIAILTKAMNAISQDAEYIKMFKQTYQDTPWALTGVEWIGQK